MIHLDAEPDLPRSPTVRAQLRTNPWPMLCESSRITQSPRP